jgi:hypothetical protein
MKKLIATLLLIFWPGVILSPAYARQAIFFSQNVRPAATGTQPCGGLECTYSFPGTNVPLANPPFTTTLGALKEMTPGVQGNTGSGSELAFYNANTSAFNANQYSCLTPSFLITGNFLASALRVAPSATTAYFLFWDATGLQIQKAVAGTFTTLLTNSTITVSHEYCFSVVGSTLTAYDNGTAVLTTTDSSITAAGAPGVGGFSAGGGITGINFRAGNCGVTGAPC